MPSHPDHLTAAAVAFLGEWHVATLTTRDSKGLPHVVPVGFTWDVKARCARVITSRGARKVANARRGGYAALCQVDHARWLTLSGTVEVLEDPTSVAEGERWYAERYRRYPAPNPERVVLLLRVTGVMGSSGMLAVSV